MHPLARRCSGLILSVGLLTLAPAGAWSGDIGRVSVRGAAPDAVASAFVGQPGHLLDRRAPGIEIPERQGDAEAPNISQSAAQNDGRVELQVKIVLTDVHGKPMPVPRHRLLVSDTPPTAPPREFVTTVEGAAVVRLPPGTYMVESDQPVTLQGKSYEWIQSVELVAGRAAVLELSAANAEVAEAAPITASSAGSLEADPTSVLTRWQDSVVAVWSPTARASGLVVDPRGFVVTNQQVVGSASSVEVQLTATRKVSGRVLAADPARGVAVVRIDAGTAASVSAVDLRCGAGGRSSVAEGQPLVAVGAPFRRNKEATGGTARAIEGRFVLADFSLAPGSAGGPVFAADGGVVGISAIAEADQARRDTDSQVVRVEEVCAVLSAAEAASADAPAPPATTLPVEPEQPFPSDALIGADGAAPSLDLYRLDSSAYDITFITPPMLHAARQATRAPGGNRGAAVDPRTIDPLDDFANWERYVDVLPAVLMIRVTPRLTEGFWTRVARGAAQTQGVSLPPIKRFKPGFLRLQAFCGEAEVPPIHPFKLEQRVTETEAVYEGLYVFDPNALGPACGSVRLVLYSEKEGQKGDSRVVSARVLQRLWDDFAAFRGAK
jgi:hypothetical protein